MKSKEELKKLFENGDIPKQEDFWEWQDSYWHKDESIEIESVNQLSQQLSKKLDVSAQQNLLDTFNQSIQLVQSGSKGIIKLIDPTPTEIGSYKPEGPGTYSNAGGLVAKEGYDTIFYYYGRTWSKAETKLPDNKASIVSFTDSTFPLVGSNSASIQRVYQDKMWQLIDGKTATATDLPSETSTIWKVVGTDKNDVLKSTISAYDNLIDFDKLIPNTYVRQDNGSKQSADGYSTTGFIKVLPQKRYLIPGLYKQFAFYDEKYQFIADNQSATAQDFDGYISIVPPINAMYIDMTLFTSKIDSYYLKLNQSLTPLRPKKTLYVSSQGGDFRRINDALKYANEQGVEHTIMIDSGEWVEKLELITSIPHALIGVSKKTTIITNRLDNLYEPIKVGGGWYFQGLSIVNQGIGYAVHVDYAGEGVTEFNDCNLITQRHAVVGAGSHQNQTLKLNNCLLETKASAVGTGILYWHNNVNDGVTGQRLEVINCNINSYADQALRIDDANVMSGAGGGNEATVMFVGNSFYSKVYGVGNNNCDFRPLSPPEAGMLVGKSIKLDPRSFGNNIPKINAV